MAAHFRMRQSTAANETKGMNRDARVEFIDGREQVLAQLNANASRAMLAVGTAAVGMINEQMQTGYGKPIWKTGDLQRDVNYEVVDDHTVKVGNSLHYAPYVHDGHVVKVRKKQEDGSLAVVEAGHVAGRPYIRDALLKSDNKRKLQALYESYLKQGFDG